MQKVNQKNLFLLNLMGGMQRKHSNFFFEIARSSHMASAFLFPKFVIRFTRGSFQY